MAATNIYPPIVDSFMPAFIIDSDDAGKVTFQMSKFNKLTDDERENLSAHVTIANQETGESLINDLNGVIIDIPIQSEGEDLYSIKIPGDKLKTKDLKAFHYDTKLKIYYEKEGIKKLQYNETQPYLTFRFKNEEENKIVVLDSNEVYPIDNGIMIDLIKTEYYCDDYKEFLLKYFNIDKKVEDLEFIKLFVSDDIALHFITLFNNGQTMCDVDITQDRIEEFDKYNWNINYRYSVQLRLSTIWYEKDGQESELSLAVWLAVNGDKFSEWSTACILKPTYEPVITFKNLKETEIGYSYDKSTLILKGIYENEDSNETLSSYRIELLETASSQGKAPYITKEDSGTIYTAQYNNTNDILYHFKTRFKNTGDYNLDDNGNKVKESDENIFYFMRFSYTTINKLSRNASKNNILGEGLIPLEIHYEEQSSEGLTIEDAKDIGFDNDEGCVSIKFEANTEPIRIDPTDTQDEINYTHVKIKRSDYKSRFGVWEDIKTISLGYLDKFKYVEPAGAHSHEEIKITTGTTSSTTAVTTSTSAIQYEFHDFSAESGVFYKYGIQYYDPVADEETALIEMTLPIVREYQYNYLIGKNGRQLRLPFNVTFNSYKRNIQESKTDAIGGKYPIFQKNGSVDYKSFSLGATIAYEMDENEIFKNMSNIFNIDAEEYEKNKDYYDNMKSLLTPLTYQREFRKEVEDFLYSGDVMLFKSATEGNIIVRLMEVNLTPNEQLGRLVYDFSSTAYEVDDNTVENYHNYNILPLDYTSNISDYEYNTEEESLGILDKIYCVSVYKDTLIII